MSVFQAWFGCWLEDSSSEACRQIHNNLVYHYHAHTFHSTFFQCPSCDPRLCHFFRKKPILTRMEQISYFVFQTFSHYSPSPLKVAKNNHNTTVYSFVRGQLESNPKRMYVNYVEDRRYMLVLDIRHGFV